MMNPYLAVTFDSQISADIFIRNVKLRKHKVQTILTAQHVHRITTLLSPITLVFVVDIFYHICTTGNEYSIKNI